MQSEAMKRAKRGDKKMLKYDPLYWQKISISRLDLGHERKCILGQTFGTFNKGIEKMEIEDDDVKHYGFDEGRDWVHDSGDAEFVTHTELNEAWSQIIAKHKGV